MIELILYFDLIEKLIEMFLCVCFVDGFLRIEAIGGLLLYEVYKGVCADTDGFDSEKEELYFRLCYEYILFIEIS